MERLGFADLTIEKLRKTDHLNPLMSRTHLDDVASDAGFRVARFRYYTPLLSSIAENILVLSRPTRWRAKPRGTRSSTVPPCVRPGRSEATNCSARPIFRALRLMTSVTMLDVTLLGGFRSGPFLRCCETMTILLTF